MTRPDWIETLRADLRPADPDPVLLAQLVELSRGSVAPATRPGRSAGARLAIVLGGAIAVGATSWAAGALPGTDSPFRPEEHVTHQPADPSPGGVGTPHPDEPASPAEEQSPSSSAGDDPPTPSDSPTRGATGSPSTPKAPGSGSPPPIGGLPTDLPSLPDVPGSTVLPQVPTAPPPSGLDHVPGVPLLPPGLPTVHPDADTQRNVIAGTPAVPGAPGDDDQGQDSQGDAQDRAQDHAQDHDSDSGDRRSPRPQEAQVARAQ
ncbi:hypothetical protein GCM10022237_03960 [Nocardioides ginsengisoli]